MATTETSALRFGAFTLHGPLGPLERAGKVIKLQPKALGVLWTLMRQAGDVVSKQALLDAVWPGLIVGEDALTFQVLALRRAIEEDPKAPSILLTAHRIGFRFAAPVNSGGPAPAEVTATPFVGRENDLAALSSAYAAATRGERQFVFVSGKAGIGKTRLVEAWIGSLRGATPAPRIARGHCSERGDGGEAYLPLLEALSQIGREAGDEAPIRLLQRTAPNWLRQLPALLTPEELGQLTRQNTGASSRRMLREFSEALELLSAERPLVLVIEDIHWSDAATLDALALLASRREPARLLVLAISRSTEEVLHNHPVRALRQSLLSRRLAREHALSHLDEGSVRRYLVSRLGEEAAEAVFRRVHERSDGHPLFLTQITDHLIAHDGDERCLSDLPPGVRELIELQLAQLAPAEQLMLEVASVAGPEFAAAAVAAGAGVSTESVEQVFDRLSREAGFIEPRGLAIWPDGTTSGRYRFLHALHEQVLVERIAIARKARLQRQIGEHLEAAYGSRSGDIAAELAHHFESAGAHERALPHVTYLAKLALDRVALSEALLQTERGQRLAATLADSPARRLAELRLHTIAVAALQVRDGAAHPRVQPAMLELERRLKDGESEPMLLQWATGLLWWSCQLGVRFTEAARYAERSYQRGLSLKDPVLQCAGLAWLSLTQGMSGSIRESEAAGLQVLAIADRIVSENPAIGVLEPACMAGVSLAHTQWFLGKPEQAFRAIDRALAGAAQIGNPYSECSMRVGGRQALLLNAREHDTIIAEYPALKAFCERYDHADAIDWSARYYLIARSLRLNTDEHLAELRQRLRAQIQGGKLMGVTVGSLGEAEICLQLGRYDEARRAMDATFDLLETYHSRAIAPEVWRIEAALRRHEAPERAEEALQRSIAIAREDGSLSFELRSAIDLARLWQPQGRAEAARALLSGVYRRFQEGFETRDLVTARELLLVLGG